MLVCHACDVDMVNGNSFKDIIGVDGEDISFPIGETNIPVSYFIFYLAEWLHCLYILIGWINDILLFILKQTCHFKSRKITIKPAKFQNGNLVEDSSKGSITKEATDEEVNAISVNVPNGLYSWKVSWTLENCPDSSLRCFSQKNIIFYIKQQIFIVHFIKRCFNLISLN